MEGNMNYIRWPGRPSSQITSSSCAYEGTIVKNGVGFLSPLSESDKVLLTDPEVLWSLTRIGVRIPLLHYLYHIPIPYEQFAKVEPFFTNWWTEFWVEDVIKKFRDQGQHDMLRIMFELPMGQNWLTDYCGGFDVMKCALTKGDFDTFNLLAQYADFDCKGMRLHRGELIKAAVKHAAPRAILDRLLDCPYEYPGDVIPKLLDTEDREVKEYVHDRMKGLLTVSMNKKARVEYIFSIIEICIVGLIAFLTEISTADFSMKQEIEFWKAAGPL